MKDGYSKQQVVAHVEKIDQETVPGIVEAQWEARAAKRKWHSWRTLSWIGFAVLLLFVSIAVHYVREVKTEHERTIRYTDFRPVLDSLQTVWRSIPGNKPVSEEFRDFESKARKLELLIIRHASADSLSLKAIEQSVEYQLQDPAPQSAPAMASASEKFKTERSKLGDGQRAIEPALEAADEVVQAVQALDAELKEQFASTRAAIKILLESRRTEKERSATDVSEATAAAEAASRAASAAAEAVDQELLKKVKEAEAAIEALAKRVPSERPRDWWERTALGVSSLLGALGDLLVKLFEWPVITFAGVLLAIIYARKVGGVSQLFGGLKSISLGASPKIEFSPQASAQISERANTELEEYAVEATKKFGDLCARHRISDSLMLAVKEGLEVYFTAAGKEDQCAEVLKKIRATVHVQDIVLDECLAQLVDYHNGIGDAGRRWSDRRGIIGLAWRSRESMSRPWIGENVEDLIRNWGMTRLEAATATYGLSRRQAFTCVVLGDENLNEEPYGLLYLDSNEKNVFQFPEGGEESESIKLHEALLAACLKHGLTGRVKKISRILDTSRYNIRLYG